MAPRAATPSPRATEGEPHVELGLRLCYSESRVVGAVVGILGSRLARETQRVREALRRRGARVVLADLSGFPGVHRAGMDLKGVRIAASALAETRVWLLRPLELGERAPSWPDRAGERALRQDVAGAITADREVGAFVESLLCALAEMTRLVNPPEAAALHGRKPLLAARLHEAGVPVPETLTTTDRRAAERFVEEHRGQVVAKAAAGGGEARMASEVLASLAAGAPLSGPLVFQRRIVGRSLRAYVVSGRVVSCREVVHGDVVDWRTDQRGLRPVDLDPAVAAMLARACEAAGLGYAGIDVEVDHAGEPFVVDVNPAPLFASYESVSGDDVAGPLADRLIALEAS